MEYLVGQRLAPGLVVAPESIIEKLALVEKMNADNAKMRAVYLDEKTRLELQNDLLKKGVENLSQRVHDLYNHKRSIQFCEEPICKINLAMLIEDTATTVKRKEL